MKKVLLLLVFGLMTIFGFGQNFEFINVGLIHGQDIQTLEVMNTLFKPDSLKSKCDSVMIKKFFKKKFNKKFILADVSVSTYSENNTIPASINVSNSKDVDTWFMSVLPQNHFEIYKNKVNVYATENYLEIFMENETNSYFFEVMFNEKIITIIETTKI